MGFTSVKDRTIKSIFRFFIQKYLGQFLKNPAADLNQLVVDISNGTGSLKQVELNEEVSFIIFSFEVLRQCKSIYCVSDFKHIFQSYALP